MNNSFARLIDGMIEVLRRDVIPATTGEFVRGQAFGVIYLLENFKLRADWSPEFIGEQMAALDDLRAALDAIPDLPPDAPRPAPTGELSVTARDRGDGAVASLIDWLAERPADAAPFHKAQAAVNAYLTRQIRHELATAARPMFAEISLGRETPEP